MLACCEAKVREGKRKAVAARLFIPEAELHSLQKAEGFRCLRMVKHADDIICRGIIQTRSSYAYHIAQDTQWNLSTVVTIKGPPPLYHGHWSQLYIVPYETT